MCLYPKLIRNPHYKNTAYICTDKRQLWVPIGCGECMECRRQKAQSWRVRLCEEMKAQKIAYFVTLTFSNEAIEELQQVVNGENGIAKLAVRRFLERYRKKYKKSLRHWLITELGHENTERIHLHGIIFPEKEMTNEELHEIWKYGITDTGEYCNIQTINYIIKYVTKVDTDHKFYRPVILCSNGLGENYTKNKNNKILHKYKPEATNETYKLNNGYKVALPIYYRNKLFTDNERRQLWSEKLDKGNIYVNGIEIRNIDTEEGQQMYYSILERQQIINTQMGYDNQLKQWKKENYNDTFVKLQEMRTRT